MSKAFAMMVRPTEFCNLACTYCYSSNTAALTHIRTDLLHQLGRRFRDEFPPEQRFQIIWHGSEPMAVGIDFYERALPLLADYVGDRLIHHIQSNLTMLTPAWIDFLEERNISISTSIDGPKALHDRARITHRGRGTFDLVTRGVRALRARDIPVSAVLVVTRATLGHHEAICALVRDLELRLRVSPAILPEENPECLAPDDYGIFLTALTDTWLNDGDATIYLEPVRSMTLRLLSGVPIICEQDDLCYANVAGMGVDGSLYPCNRFIGEDAWKLGNVEGIPLPAIPLQTVAKQASKRHLANKKCRACELVDVCRGGCMYHAHVAFGDAFREDYFCQSYVLIYDYVITHLSQLLRRMEGLPADPALDRLATSVDLPMA